MEQCDFEVVLGQDEAGFIWAINLTGIDKVNGRVGSVLCHGKDFLRAIAADA